MSAHCPGCDGTMYESEPEGYAAMLIPCPGVTCQGCAEKDAEIARLTAIVAVGREMANQVFAAQLQGTVVGGLAAKWRSLEGK